MKLIYVAKVLDGGLVTVAEYMNDVVIKEHFDAKLVAADVVLSQSFGQGFLRTTIIYYYDDDYE